MWVIPHQTELSSFGNRHLLRVRVPPRVTTATPPFLPPSGPTPSTSVVDVDQKKYPPNPLWVSGKHAAGSSNNAQNLVR